MELCHCSDPKEWVFSHLPLKATLHLGAAKTKIIINQCGNKKLYQILCNTLFYIHIAEAGSTKRAFSVTCESALKARKRRKSRHYKRKPATNLRRNGATEEEKKEQHLSAAKSKSVFLLWIWQFPPSTGSALRTMSSTTELWVGDCYLCRCRCHRIPVSFFTLGLPEVGERGEVSCRLPAVDFLLLVAQGTSAPRRGGECYYFFPTLLFP